MTLGAGAEADPQPAQVRIGLTGGIASGKSTVASLLAARGAVVIDADQLAREVVTPGTAGLEAVVSRFGPEVLTDSGELDRPKLGGLVFADPQARADLEAIVHPAVRSRAAELVSAAPPGAVVVLMIPLLVETGQAGDFDLVVVVDLPVELQLSRLQERDGLSATAALARIQAQASRAERLAQADFVIDNSTTAAALVPQVDQLWQRLTELRAQRPGPR